MELEGQRGTRQRHARGLIVAAISAVFTISRVAAMLGEGEDWLHDLSIDMFPEDGRPDVYGVGDEATTAFTQYGIECLQQIIADERQAGRAPPRWSPPQTP